MIRILVNDGSDVNQVLCDANPGLLRSHYPTVVPATGGSDFRRRPEPKFVDTLANLDPGLRRDDDNGMAVAIPVVINASTVRRSALR